MNVFYRARFNLDSLSHRRTNTREATLAHSVRDQLNSIEANGASMEHGGHSKLAASEIGTDSMWQELKVVG